MQFAYVCMFVCLYVWGKESSNRPTRRVSTIFSTQEDGLPRLYNVVNFGSRRKSGIAMLSIVIHYLRRLAPQYLGPLDRVSDLPGRRARRSSA